MESQNKSTSKLPIGQDNKIFRTNIDEVAGKNLQEMLKQLESESEFLKISLFKLNSWIINQFYKKYFNTERKQIINEHFDRKEYLKKFAANLDNESGEEIVEKIREALIEVKNPSVNLKKKKNEAQ
ncbi:MAG: hypothetical protein HQK49_21790 [Oligoflexia bacterium]|nr:hypothetical protein [Oligoflexia bacterium]